MRTLALAAAIAAASLSLAAYAQPASGPGTGMGPGSGMGPGAGMGPGSGMGPGPAAKARPGPRFNDTTTPGWSMMSKEERDAHRAKMRAFHDYGECRGYMEEHHQQMAERAKERGKALRGKGPGPGCDWLKK